MQHGTIRPTRCKPNNGIVLVLVVLLTALYLAIRRIGDLCILLFCRQWNIYFSVF